MISSVEQNYFMNLRRPKDTRISQRVRVDCFALVNCESRFSRPLELWRSLPHYWLRYSPIACYYPYCCCFQSSKFLIYITFFTRFSMLLRFSARKSVIFLTSIYAMSNMNICSVQEKCIYFNIYYEKTFHLLFFIL